MDGWDKAHAVIGLLWVLAFWFDLRAGLLAPLWGGGNSLSFTLTLGLSGVLSIGALYAIYVLVVALDTLAEIAAKSFGWLADRFGRRD